MQALAHINGGIRIGVGARGIVDVQRIVLFATQTRGSIVQRDFTHGNTNVRPAALDVHLAGFGERLHGGGVSHYTAAERLVLLCHFIFILLGRIVAGILPA